MAGQKLKTGLGANVVANGIHKELLSELKTEIKMRGNSFLSREEIKHVS